MQQTPSARPGARNLITDVAGLAIGQAQDERARTGVTVILPAARAVCAVDVRGGAPGTRETDALAPENLVEAVDAVVLSGGSVYGLGAADGVVGWLGARGRGYALAADPAVPPSPMRPGQRACSTRTAIPAAGRNSPINSPSIRPKVLR